MDEHLTQEQADEYAIGSLEPDLQRMVALHLAECGACRDLVHDSERLASHLAFVAPRKAPPRHLRRRVLTTAGITRPSWHARAWGYARTATGIAAVVVAIAAFTAMLSIRGQIDDLRDESDALEASILDLSSARVELLTVKRDLSENQSLVEDLRRDAQNDRELMIAISSPETKFAIVIPTDEQSPSVGRLVWDPEQKRVWFMAPRLNQAPDGMTYQIWVNNGGRYVSLGTFNPDASGFARYETFVPAGLDAYESAIVTVEPAGGVVERTGPPVFVANLDELGR